MEPVEELKRLREQIAKGLEQAEREIATGKAVPRLGQHELEVRRRLLADIDAELRRFEP